MNAVPKPKRRAQDGRTRREARAAAPAAPLEGAQATAQAAPRPPEPLQREHEFWESELRARLTGQPPTIARPKNLRLLTLAELAGLSPLDTDIVAALWTTSHAPAWREELASRDAFVGHLTVLGLTRSLGYPPRVRLPSESPLRLWRIVTEQAFVAGTAALSLDPHVMAWLNDEPELDRHLIGQATLLQCTFELRSWQVEIHAKHIHDRVLAGDRVRVRISSNDPTSADAFAASLARHLGLLALAIHPQTGSPADEAHECAVRVQRQAFLDQCAPCWRATDAAMACPREIPPFPVQFIFSTDSLPADARLRDVQIDLPAPDAAERRELWMAELPAATQWPQADLDELALRYEASAGEIVRASQTLPENAQQAALRIRDCTVRDLGDLARPVPCPFTWDDLILPHDVRERLEDIAFEARERAHLWSSPEAARLYPQGRGLIALFAGPPGTGKTMSAQVIAADLGLDLLRVDISSVLSKWVGETAQHLQRVLSSQCSRRAVLLFDEADALFSKRIEDTRQAQDHFINMDLSHLMIALESYTGIVLLATNLRTNLDAAFIRRIRHTVDFTTPDAAAREIIWARTTHALFPRSQGVSPDVIARIARIEATGAQIKSAALSTAFAARRAGSMTDTQLFAQMLARELAKDGTGLSSRELASLIEAPP